MAKLNTKNFCVIETNKVAAVRTGEIIAQYPLAAAIATAGVQQGQFLVVDHAAGEIKLPTDATSYVHLHASEEQMYEDHLGREYFKLTAPKLPRLYRMSIDDIIETDAIELNSLTVGGTGVFAVVGADGFLTLQASGYNYATNPVVFRVKAAVTLPNGKPGAKLVCIKA